MARPTQKRCGLISLVSARNGSSQVWLAPNRGYDRRARQDGWVEDTYDRYRTQKQAGGGGGILSLSGPTADGSAPAFVDSVTLLAVPNRTVTDIRSAARQANGTWALPPGTTRSTAASTRTSACPTRSTWDAPPNRRSSSARTSTRIAARVRRVRRTRRARRIARAYERPAAPTHRSGCRCITTARSSSSRPTSTRSGAVALHCTAVGAPRARVRACARARALKRVRGVYACECVRDHILRARASSVSNV
jgi:hypothetical protein